MSNDDEEATTGLTRDANGARMRPREQPGYYRGFSTLAQQGAWDAATRAIILARVQSPPEIEYFTAEAAQFWAIVFDHVIPQSDRIPERRVPIVSVVDRRLHRNAGGGYRYADMPSDREAYRLGCEAIDHEARVTFRTAFLDLTWLQQEHVLLALHDGAPVAAKAIWSRMSVHRFWELLIGDAADAYYAHPWAWDEIGFGGPAYPRAYTRLENGAAESWEVDEHRYEWRAPDGTLSGDPQSDPHR